MPPPECRDQLPGEIGRIPNTGAHALAKKWRHQMRRVAGNQQTPCAPSCCQFGFKTVDRLALDHAVLRRDGRPKFRPYEVVPGDHVRSFFRLEADFPAAPVARTAHIGGGARTVTGLYGVVAEVRPRLCKLDIDYQPSFLKTEIFPIAFMAARTTERAPSAPTT